MLKLKKLPSIVFVFAMICWSITSFAQQTIPAAGGNVLSSAGSVSYTIGQTFFSSNSDESGSVAEGVQHAYETLVISNVEEQFLDQVFTVFPNPTHDMLVVEGKSQANDQFKLALYDINGKMLLQKDIRSERETIDLSAFSKGTYILQIRDGNQQYSGYKIIRQ